MTKASGHWAPSVTESLSVQAPRASMVTWDKVEGTCVHMWNPPGGNSLLESTATPLVRAVCEECIHEAQRGPGLPV